MNDITKQLTGQARPRTAEGYVAALREIAGDTNYNPTVFISEYRSGQTVTQPADRPIPEGWHFEDCLPEERYDLERLRALAHRCHINGDYEMVDGVIAAISLLFPWAAEAT